MNQFFTKEMSESSNRFECFDEKRPIVPVNNCGHKDKLPYVQWFPWAEEKFSQGFRQIQCWKCKLWLFKEEI